MEKGVRVLEPDTLQTRHNLINTRISHVVVVSHSDFHFRFGGFRCGSVPEAVAADV